MRDIDIRLALRKAMEAEHSGDADTRVIEELALCEGLARIDMAVVNGRIHGYEIKSERDSLTRLPGQIAVYSRALDLVTIVVSSVHADRVLTMVPKWWGVTVATGSGGVVRLEERRRPTPNPAIDTYAQAQLLWREEALEALEERELADGVRSKPRRTLWLKLSQEAPARVGEVVRERLKRRSAGSARRDPV
jgi:hypothetical protein